MSPPYERHSGYFSLHYTHSITRGGFPVPLFRFVNDPFDPLTFHCRNGWQYRPAREFKDFDFGSVPGRAQSVVPATCATRSFVHHDSSFENHGHWVSRDGGKTWSFEIQTQHEVNHLLERMMNVEGNPLDRCYAAFLGVQVGGSEFWGKHEGPFPTCPGYK